MRSTRVPSLAGDTPILTIEGPRALSELAQADGATTLVYALNRASNTPALRRMRYPHQTARTEPVLEIAFDSGLAVRATPDQEWITPDGHAIPARRLAIGMDLRGYDVLQKLEPSFEPVYHRITSIRHAGHANTYAAHVDDVHTFVIADPRSIRAESAFTGVVAAAPHA
jgi:hypothetical protein